MASDKPDSGRERLLRHLEESEQRGMPAEEHECVVLFADIVGYSTYANRKGDAAALELVRRFEAAARGPINDSGGRVVMTAGDAILACWPKDLLSDAVSVSKGIVDQLDKANEDRHGGEQIHVRVGIHCGKVMRLQDGDLIGNGVNLACRIQTAALPGEILLSADAIDAGKACSDMPPNRRVGPMQLKGMGSPVQVHRVERAPGVYFRRALLDACWRALVPARWPVGSWVFVAIGVLLGIGTFAGGGFVHPGTTALAFWLCFVGCGMLWAAYQPRTASGWHLPIRLGLVLLWLVIFVVCGGLLGVWASAAPSAT